MILNFEKDAIVFWILAACATTKLLNTYTGPLLHLKLNLLHQSKFLPDMVSRQISLLILFSVPKDSSSTAGILYFLSPPLSAQRIHQISPLSYNEKAIKSWDAVILHFCPLIRNSTRADQGSKDLFHYSRIQDRTVCRWRRLLMTEIPVLSSLQIYISKLLSRWWSKFRSWKNCIEIKILKGSVQWQQVDHGKGWVYGGVGGGGGGVGRSQQIT